MAMKKMSCRGGSKVPAGMFKPNSHWFGTRGPYHRDGGQPKSGIVFQDYDDKMKGMMRGGGDMNSYNMHS